MTASVQGTACCVELGDIAHSSIRSVSLHMRSAAISCAQ